MNARRKTQAAERDDHAVLLGDRYERGRRHEDRAGALPADERLDAEQPARRRDDGLVVELELALDQRRADILLDAPTLVGLGVQRFVVDGDAVLPRLLRAIHRDVGVLSGGLGVLPVLGHHRHADADADLDPRLVMGSVVSSKGSFTASRMRSATDTAL